MYYEYWYNMCILYKCVHFYTFNVLYNIMSVVKNESASPWCVFSYKYIAEEMYVEGGGVFFSKLEWKTRNHASDRVRKQ